MKSQKSKAKFPPEAFDRIPRAQITFTDESVWLTKFDLRGRATATYPVALGDLAKAFNVVAANTGLIAPNLLFQQNVRGVARIGLWLAPGKRAITLAGRRSETITIPLPGFVFVGQGTRYKIFAALERPQHEHAELYHAPLPNVHQDGAVCPGNVKFPKCAPRTIHDAVKLFFESEFNHDLAEQKITDCEAEDWSDEETEEMPRGEIDPYELAHGRVRAHAENLQTFLRALKNETTFPRERLVRAGKTIRDLMEGK